MKYLFINIIIISYFFQAQAKGFCSSEPDNPFCHQSIDYQCQDRLGNNYQFQFEYRNYEKPTFHWALSNKSLNTKFEGRNDWHTTLEFFDNTSIIHKKGKLEEIYCIDQINKKVFHVIHNELKNEFNYVELICD